MSWLDELVDLGSSTLKYLSGNGIGSTLARTALTGYALNQVSKAINKENNKASDQGARLQVNPSTDAKIPVVYGRAALGGIISDASLTNNNSTMWYCLVLSEKTGRLNLGTGSASSFTFKEVYWNKQLLTFDSDGVTATSCTDANGNTNSDINGLIKVYCYNGGSQYPVPISNYSSANLANANTLFPDWSSTHTMNDLIFALVRIDYNKDKNVTSLGEMTFVIENSMKFAGDCLYDLMTNTRYGAGISPEEIYVL
jgi:hypothetical protein